MTHPLTDEICDQITDELCVFSIEDCMRDAADWQLNQVLNWCSKHIHTESVDALRKAMRPQVVDLPQANSDVCGEEGIKRALQRTFEENDELMRKLSDS